MAKNAMLAAYVEENIKAALLTIASFNPDNNLSDQIRTASRKHIENEIAGLERRVVAARQHGGDDVEAHQHLLALRAAYYSPLAVTLPAP